MKWTDNQMEGFAIYCSKNYDYISGGVWRPKNTSIYHYNLRMPTEKLLVAWRLQQITPLPSPDDLKDTKLGHENY